MAKKIMTKKKVFWTRDEFTKVADETFKILFAKNKNVFPIAIHDRIGLGEVVDEAQRNVLPPNRHAVMYQSKRERFIPALNYRFKQMQNGTQPTEPTEAVEAKTVTPSEIPVTVVVDEKPQPNAINELGQMVGAFLSSDRETMKTFINGILTAITTK